MTALTKAQMADRLFEELGLNKREAKEVVELFFEEAGDRHIVETRTWVTPTDLPTTLHITVRNMMKHMGETFQSLQANNAAGLHNFWKTVIDAQPFS